VKFRTIVALVAAGTAAATIGLLEWRKRAGSGPEVRPAWQPVGHYESLVWRPPPPLPPVSEPPPGTEPNGWVRIRIREDGGFDVRWEDRRGATPESGGLGGRWERLPNGDGIRLRTTARADGAAASAADHAEVTRTDAAAILAPGIEVRTGTWIPGSSTRYRRIP
jgi:hypothetical protein